MGASQTQAVAPPSGPDSDRAPLPSGDALTQAVFQVNVFGRLRRRREDVRPGETYDLTTPKTVERRGAEYGLLQYAIDPAAARTRDVRSDTVELGQGCQPIKVNGTPEEIARLTQALRDMTRSAAGLETVRALSQQGIAVEFGVTGHDRSINDPSGKAQVLGSMPLGAGAGEGDTAVALAGAMRQGQQAALHGVSARHTDLTEMARHRTVMASSADQAAFATRVAAEMQSAGIAGAWTAAEQRFGDLAGTYQKAAAEGGPRAGMQAVFRGWYDSPQRDAAEAATLNRTDAIANCLIDPKTPPGALARIEAALLGQTRGVDPQALAGMCAAEGGSYLDKGIDLDRDPTFAGTEAASGMTRIAQGLRRRMGSASGVGDRHVLDRTGDVLAVNKEGALDNGHAVIGRQAGIGADAEDRPLPATEDPGPIAKAADPTPSDPTASVDFDTIAAAVVGESDDEPEAPLPLPHRFARGAAAKAIPGLAAATPAAPRGPAGPGPA